VPAATGPNSPSLLRRLDEGDVLMVTRLDRLARSTRDLLNILHMLGERSIGFKSLADAWADTTTAHGRLLVTMLAGIAEFERELIRARTGEGRKRAQARGVKFGRPPKLRHTNARRRSSGLLRARRRRISRGLVCRATVQGRVYAARCRSEAPVLPSGLTRAVEGSFRFDQRF